MFSSYNDWESFSPGLLWLGELIFLGSQYSPLHCKVEGSVDRTELNET